MSPKVNIYVERKHKIISLNLAEKSTISELLQKLEISKETVIVAKDKKIVLENAKIGKAKHIDILSVVSGG